MGKRLAIRISWDAPSCDHVTIGPNDGGWQSVDEMQTALSERWVSFHPIRIENGIKYYLPRYGRTHYVTLQEAP